MRATALAVLFLGVGCVKGNPGTPTDAPPNGPQYHGGSITPTGCPYTVTTRDGAEAPVIAPPDIGPDPTPKQVRLGLGGDPKTSIAVLWRTNDETTKATIVKWGVGTALDQTTTGLTFGYQAGVNGNGGVIRMHETHLCGLTAGTTYSYEVGDGTSFTGPFQFHTAPDVTADPTATVEIGVIGDSRGGYDVQAQLMTQLATKTPDLLLFSGDAVTLGPVQPDWDDFFMSLEPLVQTVPIVAAHGNHETMSIEYFSQFANPGDEENYSLDYGWAHIAVLNDSPTDTADIQTKIPQFLDADLTAHDSAQWKFVVHHRPAYSSATAHGSDPMLQAAFVPIFDKHHVDVVMNGHDHDYERSKPLKGNPYAVEPDPSMGTIYVVDGGLGAELYGNSTNPFTAFSKSTYSAWAMQLTQHMLQADVFDPTGAPVEPSWSISK
jgi:hypothetical protein